MIDAKKTAFPESVTISIGIIGFPEARDWLPIFPFPLGQAARKNAQLGEYPLLSLQIPIPSQRKMHRIRALKGN